MEKSKKIEDGEKRKNRKWKKGISLELSSTIQQRAITLQFQFKCLGKRTAHRCYVALLLFFNFLWNQNTFTSKIFPVVLLYIFCKFFLFTGYLFNSDTKHLPSEYIETHAKLATSCSLTKALH